ncbi:MAG: transglutaminase domain-containing protein [Gammaproteobacteria bacterium]|nr:transglutaminase domain-containing protein [Gammaproteobacteria bacterium]
MKARQLQGWRAPGTQGPEQSSVAQLLWLLLLVLIVSTPHLRTLPAWVSGIMLVAAVWRLGAAWNRWPLPGRIVRGTLTLASALAVGFTWRQISGLEAGSALLVLMLALKLLETHSARDRALVVLIAWFVLFAAFLREQSLGGVPLLAAGVLVGTLALLQAARRRQAIPPATGLLLTTRLLAHAVPLALALFLLFPRLPAPLWALPSGGHNGRTGLSSQMSPGDITSLALSDAPAFRVRFEGPPPERAQLYWRGPVLESFDGRRWRTLPDAGRKHQHAVPLRQLPAGARVHKYEIVLEPHHQRWLLPLETPLGWDVADASLSASRELLSTRPIAARSAWRGRSATLPRFREARAPEAATLAVNASRNPRSLALAGEMRAAAGSDRAYLRNILGMFRQQAFYYTLEPPALGDEPVDDFLFRTRSGFCEHYASAFALLARAAGIPARVVTGYQGGEMNPLADYLIVRQSDAHAWTEVWLDGYWERYDPTAAVAPERVDAGMAAALPGSVGADLPLLGSSPWFGRVAFGWDALNAQWDRWVLAFGPEQQNALLGRLGFSSPSLRDLALVCAVTASTILLLFTWLTLRDRAREQDPLEQSWQLLCQRLSRLSRPRKPEETPGEYSAMVIAARPELAGPLTSLTALYLRLRYEGVPSRTEILRFRRLVRQLRLPPANARG